MQTELKSEMLGCPSRSYSTELKLVEKKLHNIKSISELIPLCSLCKLVIPEASIFQQPPQTILPLGSIARSENLSLLPSCFQDWCSPRVFEEEGRGQQ